jgi:hypothetical protein
MNITFYGSFEEEMNYLGRTMKEADVRVNETQAAINPGQYFIKFRPRPELPIFEGILDIKALGAEEEEQKYIVRTMPNLSRNSYKPTKAHQITCTEGE